MPAVMVVFGLTLLAGGGEALVRAATRIARVLGVTPAVIGLTVVAMGTSVPELVVSLFAALRGQPEIAISNVVGSNIFNIAAALGITALITPLPVHGNAVKLEWPFMFAASLACLIIARDGVVDRLEGGAFLIALALFIAYTVRIARRDVDADEIQEFSDEVASRDFDGDDATTRPRLRVTLGVLAAGIVGLVIGGRFLVDGAVDIARIAGMTERQIGLTVVAGGTGAPELATSVMAALRGRTDVAVANMIGSNIFNVLGILGMTALITPVAVSAAIISSDMWWMIGMSVLLLPLLHSGLRLTRIEGGVLLSSYVLYLALLLH